MTLCQKCGASVSDDEEFCYKCGARIDEPSLTFIYDQLFELLKLENQRREHLDSKAQTYIGLLSIAVTIIVSLGSLTIKDLKSQQLIASNINLIIYVLYISTVLFFISSVLFAFRAYHTGSIIMYPPKVLQWGITLIKRLKLNLSQRLAPNNSRAVGYNNEVEPAAQTPKNVFVIVEVPWLVKNSDKRLSKVKKSLIDHLGNIHSINYQLNNQKSDNLLYAYYFSVIALIFLAILFIIILISAY